MSGLQLLMSTIASSMSFGFPNYHQQWIIWFYSWVYVIMAFIMGVHTIKPKPLTESFLCLVYLFVGWNTLVLMCSSVGCYGLFCTNSEIYNFIENLLEDCSFMLRKILSKIILFEQRILDNLPWTSFMSDSHTMLRIISRSVPGFATDSTCAVGEHPPPPPLWWSPLMNMVY